MKSFKEHIQQIDEVSSELLGRYKEKAKASAEIATAKGEHGKALKRWSGHMKATGKQIEKTTKDIRKALRREQTMSEDGGAAAVGVPANAAGGGAIASIGQPPGSKYGEPGVHPKKKKSPIIAPMARRKLPNMA